MAPVDEETKRSTTGSYTKIDPDSIQVSTKDPIVSQEEPQKPLSFLERISQFRLAKLIISLFSPKATDASEATNVPNEKPESKSDTTEAILSSEVRSASRENNPGVVNPIFDASKAINAPNEKPESKVDGTEAILSSEVRRISREDDPGVVNPIFARSPELNEASARGQKPNLPPKPALVDTQSVGKESSKSSNQTPPSPPTPQSSFAPPMPPAMPDYKIFSASQTNKISEKKNEPIVSVEVSSRPARASTRAQGNLLDELKNVTNQIKARAEGGDILESLMNKVGILPDEGAKQELSEVVGSGDDAWDQEELEYQEKQATAPILPTVESVEPSLVSSVKSPDTNTVLGSGFVAPPVPPLMPVNEAVSEIKEVNKTAEKLDNGLEQASNASTVLNQKPPNIAFTANDLEEAKKRLKTLKEVAPKSNQGDIYSNVTGAVLKRRSAIAGEDLEEESEDLEMSEAQVSVAQPEEAEINKEETPKAQASVVQNEDVKIKKEETPKAQVSVVQPEDVKIKKSVTIDLSKNTMKGVDDGVKARNPNPSAQPQRGILKKNASEIIPVDRSKLYDYENDTQADEGIDPSKGQKIVVNVASMKDRNKENRNSGKESKSQTITKPVVGPKSRQVLEERDKNTVNTQRGGRG